MYSYFFKTIILSKLLIPTVSNTTVSLDKLNYTNHVEFDFYLDRFGDFSGSYKVSNFLDPTHKFFNNDKNRDWTGTKSKGVDGQLT